MRSSEMPDETASALARSFRNVRFALIAVGLVSFLINLLMLTGPLFMLQIYDRVLASGSVPTLVVIGSLAMVLYAFYGVLEGLRSRVLARLAHRIDAGLSATIFRLSTSLPIRLGRRSATMRPVQDLDAVRQFLSGAGPAAIADLPWLPLYIGIVFLFNPVLGFVALGGAVVISGLIGLNELMSKAPVAEATRKAGGRATEVETGKRNSEAIQAMGMLGALTARWEMLNEGFRATQLRASDRGVFFSTLIKTIRFGLQSAVLAAGAWLAIQQEITPGVMIAASIMTSRALAPIEQAVAQWRSFVACRQALHRLKEWLPLAAEEKPKLELPLPQTSLSLQKVSCGPFGEQTPFVTNVSFDLAAGDGLGVIGPSGSGKSTLARALVGAVPVLRGVVSYDGADIRQWPIDRRGDFIGYLPQDLQLFDGTIAQNIARFRDDANAEAITEAARLADVHDLIVGLPDGYNTVIGQAGLNLSGGQRQRLALARALYADPFLIVLDEPNSNLDAEGENALTNAIMAMRERGSVVVVIAHRPSAITAANKVLCMRDGQAVAFGPKDEVLKKVVSPVASVGGRA